MNKILEQLSNLQTRSQKIGKTRKEKIILYSEGLKAKLKQVQYAISQIESFTNRTDELESATNTDEFLISEKVNFYCDTFWTFLYSALDVLSQIINQALKLDLEEPKVSFKAVKDKLQNNEHKTLSVSQLYLKCFKSNSFSNLEKYRNCSIHRRQIYISEKTTKEKSTPGYSTSSSITTVSRLLCDDPLSVRPKTSQSRQIPKYLSDTKNKLARHIDNILAETQPVK